jgi:betaine-aldehyde dehydrogenase
LPRSNPPPVCERRSATKLFIDGRFVDAQSGRTQATLNPHDNTTIAEVAMAGPEDVDAAVAPRSVHSPPGAGCPPPDRGRILLRLADLIERDAEDLARLESLDTGHPLRDSRVLDVPRTAACYRYFGGMADKFQGETDPGRGGLPQLHAARAGRRRRAGGAVELPAHVHELEDGPALAAGNTVVMKPAEITPLTSLRIAELMAEAGMPDGVVNIVPGLGAVAGQHIAEHERIAKVAFTGSTATGRRIVQASAGNLKKVQLELGGKGANIVFDDADLDAAVNGSAWAIFHNQARPASRLAARAARANRR